jgi:hypothetical protein
MKPEEGEPGSVPMIRPPRLHLGREGTASRLELFFDLAYVLVITQLATAFVDDLSWFGLAKLAGLFIAIWFSWVGFTLYANRFDTDDLIFRLAKLLATGAIAGCAASAADAVGSTAVPFALSYLASRLILLGLYGRAWRHVPDARPTINVYLAVIGVSSVLWAVSIVTPGDLRYLLWGIAVAVDAIGPALATLRRDKLPLHIEHLPERFALLVILVLGEAVGGGVRGVHESGWAPPGVAVAAIGFVLAAAMWWIYFDIGARGSADELEEAGGGIGARGGGGRRAARPVCVRALADDVRGGAGRGGHRGTGAASRRAVAVGVRLAAGRGHRTVPGRGGDDPRWHPTQLAGRLAVAPGGGAAGAGPRCAAHQPPAARHRSRTDRPLCGAAGRVGHHRHPAESSMRSSAGHSAQGRWTT